MLIMLKKVIEATEEVFKGLSDKEILAMVERELEEDSYWPSQGEIDV